MLIQLLFVMLAAVNIAAYFLMWKDKVRAVRHGWRISENTFFLLSLLGGFIGIYFRCLCHCVGINDTFTSEERSESTPYF